MILVPSGNAGLGLVAELGPLGGVETASPVWCVELESAVGS
jgi:hypothetical protein